MVSFAIPALGVTEPADGSPPSVQLIHGTYAEVAPRFGRWFSEGRISLRFWNLDSQCSKHWELLGILWEIWWEIWWECDGDIVRCYIYYCILGILWLVGGWPTPWKIWKSDIVRLDHHPNYWKKQNIFETTNQMGNMMGIGWEYDGISWRYSERCYILYLTNLMTLILMFKTGTVETRVD